jgi:transposase
MLSEEDYRAAVRCFKKKQENPHERQRHHALLLVTKGYSYRETADILFIDEATVSHWIILYQTKGLDGLKNHPPWGGEHGQKIEKRAPTLKAALEQVLDNEIAGSPVSEEKWVRMSSERLAHMLTESGHPVCKGTISRLLKEMGLTLRANKKKVVFTSAGPEQDEQFQYIKAHKQAFRAAGSPIISVDTKKKVLIGNFKNKGRVWCKKAEDVNAYDFTSLAICRTVPYGIYDVSRNEGFVYVGTSGDTPEFAVDAIAKWWRHEGHDSYPEENQLLILADGGGSNGCRVQGWKQQLQEKVCNHLGLTVTVCHYPPGCSKWNPVERRLFSPISVNWAGVPLRSLEIMLGYIRGTSNKTGLKVKAFFQEGVYKGGQKVTQEEMQRLNMQPHPVCPKWNYTISPQLKENDPLRARYRDIAITEMSANCKNYRF